MSKLILVRHGETVYNAKGLWTGWHDPLLSPKGKKHAKAIAEALRNYGVSKAYTSELIRAKHTWQIIHEHIIINEQAIPVQAHQHLNERSYGKFAGKNKWQVKKEVGDAEFMQIRRSWDYRVPEGESLKDVYERAVPYLQKNILPEIAAGEIVISVTHGNTNRALIKHLDGLADEAVSQVEMPHELILVYHFENGAPVKKEEIRFTL
ncbi:2,3-bisphosphoglycerate-dependent phosphoglycerate mutase [Candidatus Parcubacteria bacterium]|nr:2,3-bisphosphoglycerate-dependent phosphoglycerate mutase [Candidatus Parcubacteria bacterium]